MDRVERYYNEKADIERTRLDRHRTEFAVTLRALADFFPPPPAKVIDIGGWPGRYAIELTRQGYDVTLIDLAQENLKIAVDQARLVGVTLDGLVHGNAIDLARFASHSFDAALLPGPLYHLLTTTERRQAVGEARRVLKPHGVLAASFITRFAPLRTAAKRDPMQLVGRRAQIERMLQTGVDDESGTFPQVYFAHPLEIQPMMEQLGLEMRCIVGGEGVVAGNEEQVNALEGEPWATWVDWNYRLGQERVLWGASDHLLYIGRKA